jgi:pectate lyase
MFKRFLLFLILILVGSGSALAQSIPDGRYAIINQGSGLVLDVAGASTGNGAKVQQWGYGGGEWQQFDVASQGNGFYSIRAAHSGKSLDVYSYSMQPGGEILQWDYNATANQLWAINSVGGGSYSIVSKMSGLALDFGQGSGSGTALRQYGLTGEDNQKFKFQMVDDGLSTIEDGRYVITSRFSGLSLDVAGGSKDNGANIQQWGYNGGGWQQFDVAYQGGGYYSIRSVHSGKSLDVNGYSKDAGAEILQWAYKGSDNQLWKISDKGNGYYTITSKISGMAMDVWEWSSSAGGDIRQYHATGATNQQFKFATVGGSSGGGTSTGGARADGFASVNGDTTGGAGGATVNVNNCSELETALRDSKPLTIQIPNSTIDCRTPASSIQACQVACPNPGKYTYRIRVGSQTCTDLGSPNDSTVTKTVNSKRLIVSSNKTVVGLGANSKVRGASFILGGVSNLIFRNFEITDVNPGLVEAGGAFTMEDVDHVWIDHMGFSQISDGYADMSSVKNATLSWNHFDGYNTASCDNHHSYIMFADESTVTYHHNYFDQGGGRNPKLGSGTLAHLYNNYWYDITYFAANAAGGAQAKVENNYYLDVSRPHWNWNGEALIDANMSSNVYAGSTSTSDGADTGDRVYQVPYSYKPDRATDLPSMLSSKTGPQ